VITQADLDNGTFTNTACVDDGAGGAAQQCAPATVTGQPNPHLTILKTAAESSYSQVGDVIHYTIVVTNDGNVTLNSVTVTDPNASNLTCTPANGSTLAPSATMNCTASHTIVAADLTAGHYFNEACVSSTTPNTNSPCSHVDTPAVILVNSQITPTATTCSQFSSGTSPTLSQLQYSLKGNPPVINQVNPGVFFYWVKVTASAGSNTFTISQTITTGNFDSHFFTFASGSNVYTSGCTAVSGARITQSGGTVTVTFNASSAGTYIIGIKYSATSVAGFPAPSPTTTVHYDFATSNTSGSTQGLDLVKK
jgi:uncharacterized repeat protein (TIGR01451 family)